MDTPERVARFLDLVDEHYVIRDRVAAVRERIEQRLAAGAYTSLSDPELADAVTADLRECTGDLHFKVIHKAKPQPARKTATEESPEEVAEFRRIARFANYGCTEVKRLPGNVGYWRIDEFYDLVDGSGPTFVASMNVLTDTDALIVDVSTNSGGDSGAVALACSFLFDVEPVHLNTMETSGPGGTIQSWTQPHLDCARYLDKPVYVLISRGTVSAAEEFAYDLQALDRATLVGQPTRGAAHAREQFQLDAHFFINIPTQRPVNPSTNANWEGEGVLPGVEAAAEDALAVAYRAALEVLSRRDGLAPAEAEEIRQALRGLS